MKSFVSFGDPSRFEIAFKWVDDKEPAARHPADSCGSLGSLRLTVANQVLTRHWRGRGESQHVTWFLLPILDWIADNWVELLHEEHLAWVDNRARSAATNSTLAIERFIVSPDPKDRKIYDDVQSWWQRHSLRAADPGGLLPDLVLRRLGDDIEVSWTARQPVHAPDGFAFSLSPGVAKMPVSQVAEPLWHALEWATEVTDGMGLDLTARENLRHKLVRLRDVSNEQLERAYLPGELVSWIRAASKKLALENFGLRLPNVPAIDRIDDAVLMFGGANPDIQKIDVNTILKYLNDFRGGADRPRLGSLVENTGPPMNAAYDEGYQLAEDLLDRLTLPADGQPIDVLAVLSQLGIEIVDVALQTETVRGVAIAGEHYTPAILVNRTSPYNKSTAGRRFSCAHELCHILFDRGRAKRITHTSGRWAPPDIEKRANAFAAMFLMPRQLLREWASNDLMLDEVFDQADRLTVGVSALIEHLYNTGFIDELKRDELREPTRR